jgi:hypothetical protein
MEPRRIVASAEARPHPGTLLARTAQQQGVRAGAELKPRLGSALIPQATAAYQSIGSERRSNPRPDRRARTCNRSHLDAGRGTTCLD